MPAVHSKQRPIALEICILCVALAICCLGVLAVSSTLSFVADKITDADMARVFSLSMYKEYKNRCPEKQCEIIEDFICIRVRAACLSSGVYKGNPWEQEEYAEFYQKRQRKPEMPVPGTVISSGDAKMWAAVMCTTRDGEVLGEVVFKGTVDLKDWVTNFKAIINSCLERGGPYVGRLVGFVKKNKVTKLDITGHSLGGLRACAFGLHAQVVDELKTNVENLYSCKGHPSDIIRHNIRVTAFDPAGNAAKCEDTELDPARAEVIMNISHSITVVSKYATRLLSPLWVFAAPQNSKEDHAMRKIKGSMVKFINNPCKYPAVAAVD